MSDQNDVCAIIIGGYINGYSIIRELNHNKIKNIWLFDYHKSLASRSNKIIGFTQIEKSSTSLANAVLDLKDRFSKLIIYPTDDLQLEMLAEIYDQISCFCFIPFNRENILSSLDKGIQYGFCHKLGIPFPKTSTIAAISEIDDITRLEFPVLIKPNKREDIRIPVFRSLLLACKADLDHNHSKLSEYIKRGVKFIASEYVPGDDTNIYAYTAYRNHEGVILEEWIGKKLSQCPDEFGVFSSSCNQAPEIVRQQGRKLVNEMNLYGIIEPEFKFDCRDNSYKLMEINLRSMMWHRLGFLSGAQLQYTQWRDATRRPITADVQDISGNIHFVYMKHEIINLLSRKSYWKTFLHNVFQGVHKEYAVFDAADLKPFIFDLFTLPRAIAATWLKQFRKRYDKN